jgi:tRNA A37 threonylcarbamoyladenosine synthetase subunit TsaC/SUA5/YrdC
MRRLIVHPDNPQARLIQQAAQALHDGDLLIMPTDACAVIAASMAHKSAVDRLRAIRQLNDRHLLTLLCPGLDPRALHVYPQCEPTGAAATVAPLAKNHRVKSP